MEHKNTKNRSRYTLLAAFAVLLLSLGLFAGTLLNTAGRDNASAEDAPDPTTQAVSLDTSAEADDANGASPDQPAEDPTAAPDSAPQPEPEEPGPSLCEIIDCDNPLDEVIPEPGECEGGIDECYDLPDDIAPNPPPPPDCPPSGCYDLPLAPNDIDPGPDPGPGPVITYFGYED